jgi:hypothetical protein
MSFFCLQYKFFFSLNMHQSLLPHLVHFVSRLFNNPRYGKIKMRKLLVLYYFLTVPERSTLALPSVCLWALEPSQSNHKRYYFLGSFRHIFNTN